MPRKKKFRANGGSMMAPTFTHDNSRGATSLVVELTDGEGASYRYEFCADERQGNLAGIELRLRKAFADAIQDFSNIEITEEERSYLFVEIQGSPIQQYTGRRLD